MPDNVSDNEKPLDRGSIMEGAEFLAACYALKELVEDRRGYRWASQNGIRLKDTAEWAAFYVAVNKKQSGQSSPAAPVDGLVWQSIDTAPKDGSEFLAYSLGEIEEFVPADPASTYTKKSFPHAFRCWFCFDDTEQDSYRHVFCTDYGDLFYEDGRIYGCEDLTEADDVLRLGGWCPLPAIPNAIADAGRVG